MQKRYIPLAVFFVVLLVFLAHFGARLSAVPAFTYAAGAEEKKVYLTFDDGPSTKVTNRILDILQEEDIKATFFVVSDRAYGRNEVLRRIAAEGHTLGVHSKTHDYSKIYASDETLLKDIDACANAITKITGVVPRVYRFPGGGKQFQKRLTPMIEAKGYRVARWNAVCGDEEIMGASAELLAETARKTSAGKNTVVLLCHDSASHMATADALPAIIADFRARGYTFCAY